MVKEQDLKLQEKSQPSVDENKQKAVSAAILQIEKQFGKGSIMRLTEETKKELDVISTSSISLDYALGVGGIPKGRVIEIFGQEATGKTTLALHIIAEAQKTGGIAAFIDTEHALDIEYAKKIGVDLDNLYLSQPDYGEQSLEIAETLVRSGGIDVVVIDSVAALVPKAEIEGEMGDSHMGLQARLMSQALRKLVAVIGKSKTCAIFTNQLRQKIGVMFGSPDITTGGTALKYYASIRLDLRKVSSIKEGENHIGNRIKIKVIKNKVAPPFREAEVDILFNEGISKIGDVLDTAIQHQIIEKSGTWLSFENIRLGQGRDNAKISLQQNKELFAKIETKLREKLGLKK